MNISERGYKKISDEVLEKTKMCATANMMILSLLDELKECEQNEFINELVSRLTEIQNIFKNNK